MNMHERRRRAREACRRCEAELNRLLRQSPQAKQELDRFARALTLLEARAKALEATAEQEATA